MFPAFPALQVDYFLLSHREFPREDEPPPPFITQSCTVWLQTPSYCSYWYLTSEITDNHSPSDDSAVAPHPDN